MLAYSQLPAHSVPIYDQSAPLEFRIHPMKCKAELASSKLNSK